MKFLKQLLNTKAPSSQRLLDIAIILSIIPHLFVMKFFMYLYCAVALAFIFKKQKYASDRYILMGIGLVLILVSFFNNYNFSNFSRMQFFVSLVSSLLIYAVSLQKLTGVINVYLKISPALLMLLSFFFFESITMLLYSIFTLFVFVLLNIWSRMDAKLIDVLKKTSQLFVLSLPAVVILFLVFPRISFQKAEFGFQADSYISSGYDGTMKVSLDNVRLSNRVVMEVSFKDKIPLDNELYFRGSTLYKEDGLEWKRASKGEVRDRLAAIDDLIDYDVSIYPHGNNWVYTLGMPLYAVNKTNLNGDFTLNSQKPVFERKKYNLRSALSYRLYTQKLSEALKVDTQKSERTYNALKDIRVMDISDAKKASYLMSFFMEQNLSYTLRPKELDLEDFTDSFLFDSKKGYCVHFASAFAKSARILGIPSRVVTGFKSNKENMMRNYLVVKASDAHAWVELYLDDMGWVKFEPTATAARNLDEMQNAQEQQKKENTLFQRANLYFMYVKYVINNWVLDYNRLKQLSILNKLLNDTIYLMKFVLAIFALIFVSFLLYINIKSSTCKDKIICEMNRVTKRLEKYDLVKKESETMKRFLQRAQKELDISLLKISEIYHRLKYAKNTQELDLKELKDEIKSFERELKKKSNKR